MSKVSVNYYLNKNLKPTIENGIEYYPLYIRVVYKRKLSRIRSIYIPQKVSEIQLSSNSDIISGCKQETDLINSFFRYIESKIQGFDLKTAKTSFPNWIELYNAFDFLTLLSKSFYITTEEKKEIRLSIIKKLSNQTKVKEYNIANLITETDVFQLLKGRGALRDFADCIDCQLRSKIECYLLLKLFTIKHELKAKKENERVLDANYFGLKEWEDNKSKLKRFMLSKVEFSKEKDIDYLINTMDLLINRDIQQMYLSPF